MKPAHDGQSYVSGVTSGASLLPPRKLESIHSSELSVEERKDFNFESPVVFGTGINVARAVSGNAATPSNLTGVSKDEPPSASYIPGTIAPPTSSVAPTALFVPGTITPPASSSDLQP